MCQQTSLTLLVTTDRSRGGSAEIYNDRGKKTRTGLFASSKTYAIGSRAYNSPTVMFITGVVLARLLELERISEVYSSLHRVLEALSYLWSRQLKEFVRFSHKYHRMTLKGKYRDASVMSSLQ